MSVFSVVEACQNICLAYFSSDHHTFVTFKKVVNKWNWDAKTHKIGQYNTINLLNVLRANTKMIE